MRYQLETDANRVEALALGGQHRRGVLGDFGGCRGACHGKLTEHRVQDVQEGRGAGPVSKVDPFGPQGHRQAGVSHHHEVGVSGLREITRDS